MGPVLALVTNSLSDETARQTAAQSPSEKNKAIGSPAPGISFVTAAVGSDRN